MKILKISIFAVFFLLSAPMLFAQDEIYNEKPKTEKISNNNVEINENELDNYYTEKDYNAKFKQRKVKNSKEDKYVDEDYNSRSDRHRNNDVAVQVAAEIVFDVVINAIFIVATFWN